MRRVFSSALWLAVVASAASAGCKYDRYDHHYPDPQPHQDLPCEAPHVQQLQQVTAPGYRNVVFDFTWYGGTSSWTHDGDPPAGDRCPPVPPGVTPRPAGERLSQR